jgi:uncharacterized membrane protein YeaQ/YmgE (transglycosylase-associated protein family)
MWNFIVFALIGLFAGSTARMLYPGRQPVRILGTIVLGIIGALVLNQAKPPVVGGNIS